MESKQKTPEDKMTLQEAKDKVSQDKGYACWSEYITIHSGSLERYQVLDLSDEAAELYAAQFSPSPSNQSYDKPDNLYLKECLDRASSATSGGKLLSDSIAWDLSGRIKKLVSRISVLEKESESLLDIAQESFHQDCWVDNLKKFDHGYLSTYEEIQALLIEKGRIKKEDCYRD